VLRRLDARILEYSHGELGWDCFALEYKVEAPLNAVLDERSMVGTTVCSTTCGDSNASDGSPQEAGCE
jgi:hypothetical protein